ncbi:MAG TPA: 3-dehydroquinate synthase [Candidatus Magasanikbacteria bacterium]|nr:3-dehydroquinate synthase [Candidatus Magasanikbacteria bacterium]
MTDIKIQIKLPNIDNRQYDIVIGDNIIKPLSTVIKTQTVSNLVIITDSNVKKLYGDKLLCDLKKNLKSYTLSLMSFDAGEKNKTQTAVNKLQDAMFKLKCGRDTLVIALGGGVVGDVAGFVAATYMRGIPYIQVPTTLLAMVDSSVGGKTGIDTKYGKNLIGAFHQPVTVFINPDYLKTLPKEHLLNGLVEVVKMFLTHDKAMFNFVKVNYNKILNLDKVVIEKVIFQAIKIKAGVVMRDEKEIGERSILNFGHTIGHALEKLSNYKIMHGEAVGLGMIVELNIALLVGKISKNVYDEVFGVIEKMVKIERLKDFRIEDVLEEIKLDKKSKNNKSRFVLLKEIGKFCKHGGKFVHEVDEKIIIQALKSYTL